MTDENRPRVWCKECHCHHDSGWDCPAEQQRMYHIRLLDEMRAGTAQVREVPNNFDFNKPLSGDAFATQVGGGHYTKLAIQPMEYSLKNGLDAAQHTVIKYVTRFRDKNGVEDLRKAIHTLELLIAYEEAKGG